VCRCSEFKALDAAWEHQRDAWEVKAREAGRAPIKTAIRGADDTIKRLLERALFAERDRDMWRERHDKCHENENVAAVEQVEAENERLRATLTGLIEWAEANIPAVCGGGIWKKARGLLKKTMLIRLTPKT
jgi:hypothetical protein